MKSPTETYSGLLAQFQNKLYQLNQHSGLLSLFRFLSIAIAFALTWFYFSTDYVAFLIGAILFLGIFIFMIRLHNKLSYERKIVKARIAINEEELAYLNDRELPFKDGKEFSDSKHFFTYDLDVFGHDSLYQHLNRTATYSGENTLAKRLSDLLPDEKIVENQEAVEELRNKTEWRQNIYAIARNIDDSAERNAHILEWAKRKDKGISKAMVFLSWILPAALWFFIIYQIFAGFSFGITLINVLIFTNIFILFSYYKRIKNIFTESDNISKTLKGYALMLTEIENEKFDSSEMMRLQNTLKNSKTASNEIARLSNLFGQLEQVLNLLGALISNGFFLYHIRVLNHIYKWKEKNAGQIETWLKTIGEAETLNSLANFAFNNPEYGFPKINNDQIIEFKEAGHPLISRKVRIDNDISFREHPFVVLTGSNMSGKSTFLRTLGINMVLARAGSVVCAKDASLHPLPILVSMRVEDSLTDNESYFFAEVNRLHRISQEVQKGKCFVLLDEILRGTNSDDKRKGTKEFIKALMKSDIIGVIATHDLDICTLQKDYSDKIINKYFEVDIVDNELAFDYKIRDGICQNQSATFLMKKKGII
ncbi:MAG: DNA mismatch repair protein [Marinilabiliales bacterium]|nr:MAG: DNA mismatch repair protein [Marinilabiliales bacterium]